MSALVESLFAVVLELDGAWRDELDRDELVTLWLDVDLAHRQLADVLKLLGMEATDRLADREDPLADYVTAKGDVVHLARGYAAERWRGRDLLDELSQPITDADGVIVARVVDVDVLADVLPGCATPELTSSKWRTTGLSRYVEGWRRYRSRDTAPLVIRRGTGER